MVDFRVDTISRLAQWRIDIPPDNFKKSDSFKIGIWNWRLAVCTGDFLHIGLFLEASKEQPPPIARFILRVSSDGINCRPYISPVNEICNFPPPAVHEKLVWSNKHFFWSVRPTFNGRYTVFVEFLDLKICPVNGGEAKSIWPMEGMMHYVSSQTTLQCFSRMLDESIHADVTINTIDGTLQAHKAILSASSPVFNSMFHHNFKEKETSIICIQDMSLQACLALLRYLYGTIKREDFWKYRLPLLEAANKYAILDLKDACEESLLEDIDSTNVLERLQKAWLFQLLQLKKGCLTYLFDFRKVYDLGDEIDHFFGQTHPELMKEMFQQLLTLTKPV